MEHAEDNVDAFISHFHYHSHDVTSSESYVQLKQLADKLNDQYELEGNRIFYLAMAPEFFGIIAEQVKAQGLTDTKGYKRLVIEKPFGKSFETAQVLNEQIRAAFNEEEIYRIDHYLGKEMVQNIEVIRFSNALFEPLWNNRYISNIQITSSEILGVEERGRYYETQWRTPGYGSKPSDANGCLTCYGTSYFINTGRNSQRKGPCTSLTPSIEK